MSSVESVMVERINSSYEKNKKLYEEYKKDSITITPTKEGDEIEKQQSTQDEYKKIKKHYHLMYVKHKVNFKKDLIRNNIWDSGKEIIESITTRFGYRYLGWKAKLLEGMIFVILLLIWLLVFSIITIILHISCRIIIMIRSW